MKQYNLPKIYGAQKRIIRIISENLYRQTKDVGDNMIKMWDDLKPNKLKS